MSKARFLAQLEAISDQETVLIHGKHKSFLLQTRSERGSRFRGVSKNGTKWQVMVVRGTIKKYVGAIDDELQAARLYDRYALIIQGFEVSNYRSVFNSTVIKRPSYNLNNCKQTVIVHTDRESSA